MAQDATSGPAPHLAVLALYDRLDADIAQTQPECRACGRCCDFPHQGYVLYATTAEVDLALAQKGLPSAWPRRELCPFQVDGRCANRLGRPLGCRTYYCRSFEIKGPLLYTRYHDRLKAIISDHGQAYHYAPFLGLLAEAWERFSGSQPPASSAEIPE